MAPASILHSLLLVMGRGQRLSPPKVSFCPVFMDSQILTVAIDGGKLYNTTYDDPSPQSYCQWYQSPWYPPRILDHGHGTRTSLSLEACNLAFLITTAHIKVWLQGTLFHSVSLVSAFDIDLHFANDPKVRLCPSAELWAKLGSFGVTYALDGTPFSQTMESTTPQFMGNSSNQNNLKPLISTEEIDKT